MSAVASGQINVTSPADLLHTISRILETRMAGTLGSLLSVMFMSFSQAFFKYPVNIVLGPAMWVDGLAQGTMAVKAYGMCQPGDRTLLDALVPAVRGMEIILRESKNPVIKLFMKSKVVLQRLPLSLISPSIFSSYWPHLSLEQKYFK